MLGIQEYIQVVLELEQLEDELLRPSVVHGRKKLQALADTGSTVTEVVDIITIEDELIEEREDAAEDAAATAASCAIHSFGMLTITNLSRKEAIR